MIWRTAGMQRPGRAPTLQNKKRTGTQIFDLEDAALFSGQVGDLFRFNYLALRLNMSV